MQAQKRTKATGSGCGLEAAEHPACTRKMITDCILIGIIAVILMLWVVTFIDPIWILNEFGLFWTLLSEHVSRGIGLSLA